MNSVAKQKHLSLVLLGGLRRLRGLGCLFLAAGLLFALALRASAADVTLPEDNTLNWTPLEAYSFFDVDPTNWRSPDDFASGGQQSAKEETSAGPGTVLDNKKTQMVLAPLTRPVNLPLLPSARGGYVESDEMFDFDASGWMSMDRYANKYKMLASDESETDEEALAEAGSPGKDGTEAEEAVQTVQIGRPLKPPVMPGLNQYYDMRISSTEDDNPDNILAQPNRPLNLPVMPGLNVASEPEKLLPESKQAEAKNIPLPGQLEDVLWQDAATAALDSGEEAEINDRQNTLSIRLANLPDTRITPVPGKTVAKKRPSVLEKMMAPKVAAATSKKQPSRNPEVCEALTAYKKQQLAAIERDRETLSALRAAVAELGLANKLDFMSGVTGILSGQAEENAAGQAGADRSRAENASPMAEN